MMITVGKNFLKGEIKAENVDFQLNGASTTGTVNFEATSLQSATVGFKNVIDGYSDVTVDVAMENKLTALQIQWDERYYD